MPFEVPERIGLAAPDSGRLLKIRERLAKSTAPVRPLPSNLSLMLVFVAVLIGLAVLFAIPVGFNGVMKMSAIAAGVEYSLLTLLALVLAGGVVAQMIPGSRQILSPVAGLLLAAVLLALTAGLLFPVFGTHDFVRLGYPCIRLGVVCALPAAGLTWAAMRRGFVVDPVAAAVAGGAFSGLLGILVLALHCPILEAAHIIVWHVAVIGVTAAMGAFLGWIAARAG